MPRSVQRAFWQAVRSGCSVPVAAASVGVSYVGARKWFVTAGGVNPFPAQEPSRWRLSFAEREEIALLHCRGVGVNQIAREIGISQIHVSRLTRHALVKLRAEIGPVQSTEPAAASGGL